MIPTLSRTLPNQVEPILEVLVGKTLELSVLELMEVRCGARCEENPLILFFSTKITLSLCIR